MADRYTTIFGDQIDVTALGLGLQKDVDDNVELNVDDSTVELSLDSGSEGQLRVKDLGITSGKLADDAVTIDKILISNSANTSDILKWNGTNFEWIAPASIVDINGITDSDYIVNEIPSGTIGTGNVTFTLATTPVVGTVQVYLNGILQSPGGGNDYTISGATITFVKAPRVGSTLLASYIVT